MNNRENCILPILAIYRNSRINDLYVIEQRFKWKWEPLVGISVGGVGPLIKCLSYRSYPQTPEPNGSQQSGKARAAPPCTQRERGRCVYEKRLGNHPNRPVDEGLKPIGLWYASEPRIMSLKPTNYGGCNPKTAFFPSFHFHTYTPVHHLLFFSPGSIYGTI